MIEKIVIPASTCRLAVVSNQAFSIINFRGSLIREMVTRGVTVFALASDYTPESRAAVTALGCTPVDYSLARTGMNPVRDLLDTLRLVRTLRRLNVDMTLAYFIKPAIYGTLAAWLAGVRHRIVLIEGAGYVFTGEPASMSVWRRILRSMVVWLYRVGLARAELVFLLNRDDEQLFVGERMAQREQIRLLRGIGLDLQHFRLAAPAVEPLSFILVARLLREKGVLDYVEAARIVKATVPSARFYLVGDVDMNPGSISTDQVREWVSEGLIEWPGHVTDVRGWIARASVFVLPSYREGLPRSTQEAMAMGRPVITTDVPGCRETVLDGINGFLVPPRDPARLAEAMLKFAQDPTLIGAMGAKSHTMATEQFDVHAINAFMLQCMGIVSGASQANRCNEQ